MTRKPLPPISTRYLFWLGWKLAILLSISFCGYALIRLHHHSQTSSSALQIYRARSLSYRNNFTGTPKLAFLFLVRREIPLDFLWSSFFEGADGANFSIYIHSEPGFVFDGSTTRSNFFYGRQLRDSIKVAWGESSMIEAERLLFAAALEDPANQRFILLSDSCVPLYNFSYIYSYLMSSSRSFIDSFLDEREGRYNPIMSPSIPRNRWRKGSQWITLVRKHAEVLVDDEDTISVFKKFCKRRPPVDLSMGKLNTKLQKQHNCIPDEHYVQTLFAMNDLEGEVERRTVTYTLWNRSLTTMESQSWHPFTFGYENAGTKQIQEIKSIHHVYYESEYRTEWCRTNSTFIPCFLFARKFSRGAAMRLLSEGVIGHFDIASLFDSVT